MDAFNKSFEESFLTSVFSGRNGTTTRIIQHGTTDPRKNFSGFKVQFIFGEEQTIMLNGEEYYPATDTSKTPKLVRCRVVDSRFPAPCLRHFATYA